MANGCFVGLVLTMQVYDDHAFVTSFQLWWKLSQEPLPVALHEGLLIHHKLSTSHLSLSSPDSGPRHSLLWRRPGTNTAKLFYLAKTDSTGHYDKHFFKMGQSRRIFFYFCYFLIAISIIQIEKSVDGVLGIWTQSRWKVGPDETTELWQPPILINILPS